MRDIDVRGLEVRGIDVSIECCLRDPDDDRVLLDAVKAHIDDIWFLRRAPD